MPDLATPTYRIACAHRPSAGPTHVARNPATLEEVGRAETTPEEMETALDTATAAQAGWTLACEQGLCPPAPCRPFGD